MSTGKNIYVDIDQFFIWILITLRVQSCKVLSCVSNLMNELWIHKYQSAILLGRGVYGLDDSFKSMT